MLLLLLPKTITSRVSRLQSYDCKDSFILADAPQGEERKVTAAKRNEPLCGMMH